MLREVYTITHLQARAVRANIHVRKMSSYSHIPYGPSCRPWRESLSQVAVSAADGELLVSPPSSDPLQQAGYTEAPGITSVRYQVPSSGLTQEEHDTAMEETERVLKNGCSSLFGYQHSQGFQCPPCLQSPLTGVFLNSSGDPFAMRPPRLFGTKWLERNVLDYYASLWNARWPYDPTDPETYWGYILAMGATEGNLHAMWSARNYLSGKYIKAKSGEKGNTHKNSQLVQGTFSTSNPNSFVPVVFYSKASNHSLKKAADVTNLAPFHVVGSQMYPNQNPLGGEWTEGVPCTGGDAGPDSVDIDALAKLVDFFSGKGHPIMVVFNYGTTLKGSCDDVQKAGETLVSILKRNNMYERNVHDPNDPSSFVIRNGFWFHVDGALSAAYMPFLEMAHKNGLTDIKSGPVFDFRLDFVMSIVTSGHKWVGVPWPCGVYITKSGLLLQSSNVISIINSSDAAISVSRNAHSLILLWSYISKNAYDTEVQSVLRCLNLVSYAVQKLKELEKEIGSDLWITNYEPSLAILFRRPNTNIVVKYTLACQSLCIKGQLRYYCHIYVMQHTTTDLIDSLIEDLRAPDAFSSFVPIDGAH